MENLKETEKFTVEEIALLKEQFAAQTKEINYMLDLQSSFANAMKTDADKATYKTMRNTMFELKLLTKTMEEEPELLLETKSPEAIVMGMTVMEKKKLVGFKKKYAISILNKLDNEMALIQKKADDTKG